MEFADFQCEFCAQFERDVWPTISREYVDTGIVLFAFRHLPLPSHPFAPAAAESALCVGQQGADVFWRFHDGLFHHGGVFDAGVLDQEVTAAGARVAQYRQCMKGESQGALKRDIAEAATFGIAATPTFIIGRLGPDGDIEVKKTVVGYRPLEEFRKAIDSVRQ